MRSLIPRRTIPFTKTQRPREIVLECAEYVSFETPEEHYVGEVIAEMSCQK